MYDTIINVLYCSLIWRFYHTHTQTHTHTHIHFSQSDSPSVCAFLSQQLSCVMALNRPLTTKTPLWCRGGGVQYTANHNSNDQRIVSNYLRHFRTDAIFVRRRSSLLLFNLRTNRLIGMTLRLTDMSKCPSSDFVKGPVNVFYAKMVMGLCWWNRRFPS